MSDYDEPEYNEERLAMWTVDDEWPVDLDKLNPTMRHIWSYVAWFDEHGCLVREES